MVHSNPSFKRVLLLALCVVAASLHMANASTLTWSSYTWSAGTPTNAGAIVYQGFNVDNAYTGNEITVSVKNSNTTNNVWQAGYPQISSSPNSHTGLSSVLQLYAQGNNNTGGITTTIFFNYSTGVKNVSFTLWDVDASGTQFIDLISNIYAVTVTGQVVAATAITTSGDNTKSSTVITTTTTVSGTANANNTSTLGDVIITFNTTEAIRYVSFTWSNKSYSGAQAISVGNISYTIAPEIGVSQVALLVCLLAMLVATLRARRGSKRGHKPEPAETLISS